MKYKSGNSGANAGCVKAHSEETVAMIKTGGKKYSQNNPKEIKAAADALAGTQNKK